MILVEQAVQSSKADFMLCNDCAVLAARADAFGLMMISASVVLVLNR